MGNCNGLPYPSDQPLPNHHDSATSPPPPPPNNVLNIQPSSFQPPPKRPAPVLSGVGRVLGRPMEDVRATYIFGRELGRGQFGVTYLVTHKTTRQQYACKSIATRKLINKDDVEDVRREVQIMHHLTGHRNIVELKGAYEDRHSVNLVMELCAGGELFDRIIAKGHYSERAAAVLCRQMVTVVHNCHSMGVMHRDLKPENFLLFSAAEDSPLKATDFGLSVFFKPGDVFKDLVGSAYYVAPEVLRRNYGAEADVWSAGVILYILLSGVPPFWGENEQGIFDAILRGHIDFSSDPWPSISSSAKDLVKKMLQFDPKERLSAVEVLSHPWMRELPPFCSLHINKQLFQFLIKPATNTSLLSFYMGFLPYSLPCQPHEETDHSNHLIHSDSSNISSVISSQPSLPSVPSLNPPSKEISTVHHRCISILKGHSSYIFSLILTGERLYSGSSNGEIRVWSTNSSSQVNPTNNIVSSCNSAAKSLVVSGDKLYSAHQDHKIRIWKINDKKPHKKYKCISTLPTLNDRVSRLFMEKNYVEIRRHKKCTWVHHVDTVSALALSRDASLLYSTSWDRTFKVWRTSDFKCLESVWSAHDDAINSIVLSHDGFVYTCSADKKIKVWRKKAGEKKHSLVDTLEKHKSAVNALALSIDGSLLYSGACDRSIIVWEKIVDNGRHMVVAGALRGHTNAILCLAVVSDFVCSGSADKTVRIWRRETGESYTCLAVLEGHRGPVKCLTAAVDSSSADKSSTTVYSGSLDCDIKVWQLWVPIL